MEKNPEEKVQVIKKATLTGLSQKAAEKRADIVIANKNRWLERKTLRA